MLDTSTLNGKPAGRAGWKTVLPIQKHEFVVGWRAVLKAKSCSQNRKKTIFDFGGGISGGDVTKKAFFGNFTHLWPALGPNPLLFWLKVLLKTRSKSASIEPFIDLLAYL